jgi:hypothetical protein
MLLALALAAVLETAPGPLPTGWREPTRREVNQAARVWRKEDKGVVREPSDQPYHDPVYELVADFDGDGRIDRAALLINDKARTKGLFVRRAATGRYEPLDDGKGDGTLAYYAMETLKPGEYTDIVDRGGDNPGLRVRIALPSIYVAYGESSSQTFYWDGEKFATIWLTD